MNFMAHIYELFGCERSEWNECSVEIGVRDVKVEKIDSIELAIWFINDCFAQRVRSTPNCRTQSQIESSIVAGVD